MNTLEQKRKELAAFYAVITGGHNNEFAKCDNLVKRMRELIKYNPKRLN